MRIVDVLKFKTPHRVDWDATEKNIAREISRHYTNDQSAACVMEITAVCEDVRRKVMRIGVNRAYRTMHPTEATDG